MSTDNHKSPTQGVTHEAVDALDLKVRFGLDAAACDVLARLEDCVAGTGLRLIHLEADGRALPVAQETHPEARGMRWEAVLSVPGEPGLTATDVEGFLRKAHAYLPSRSSVVLSGVQRPAYGESIMTSTPASVEAP